MKQLITGVLTVLALCCACVACYADTFQAAAAKIDITPTGTVYIAGYAGNRKSQGVHDPLWARCVVVRNNGETVALVSCDLLGLGRYYIQGIRRQVTRIDPSHVLVGVTHTHSGPDTYGQWGPSYDVSGVDKAWMALTCRRIARLVDQTVLALRPARVRFGSVGNVKGCSRNSRAPVILDTELCAMQLTGVDAKPIATVINYACHPEVLNNHHITADFPYWLRQRVESRCGGMAVYFNGAQGGMVTADTLHEAEYPKGEDWADAQRIGETLGDYTIQALAEGNDASQPKVKFRQRIFNVTLESITFKAMIAAGIYPKELAPNGIITTEVSRLVVGSAEFLTLPGEVLPNIGLYLKRKMGGQPRFLLGLTGDALGYILTPEDFALKLYSYESSVSVGSRIGRIMEDNLLALMTEPDNVRKSAPRSRKR